MADKSLRNVIKLTGTLINIGRIKSNETNDGFRVSTL